jgi:hypothetical protein
MGSRCSGSEMKNHIKSPGRRACDFSHTPLLSNIRYAGNNSVEVASAFAAPSSDHSFDASALYAAMGSIDGSRLDLDTKLSKHNEI